MLNTGITTAPRVIGTSSHINKQSRDSRLDSFFKNLASCGTKPGILSVISDYSDTYIPYLDKSSFPKPLKELFEQKYLSYCYLDLLNVSDKIEINMTQEMSDLIERETRDQSNSKLWFEYRAGRITASRMRSVCHTNSSNPSQSLIKTIVYPEAFKFSTNSTIWGCSHEKNARLYYEHSMKGHEKFSVANSGLCINPQWPHIGASPDGKVNCKCCGKGVLEIKCPYCIRNEDLTSIVGDKKGFCLSKDSEGNLRLNQSHSYYYQIQTQIFVCYVTYCDLVVCTFPDGMKNPSMHVERIVPDVTLWTSCLENAFTFF